MPTAAAVSAGRRRLAQRERLTALSVEVETVSRAGRGPVLVLTSGWGSAVAGAAWSVRFVWCRSVSMRAAPISLGVTAK